MVGQLAKNSLSGLYNMKIENILLYLGNFDLGIVLFAGGILNFLSCDCLYLPRGDKLEVYRLSDS